MVIASGKQGNDPDPKQFPLFNNVVNGGAWRGVANRPFHIVPETGTHWQRCPNNTVPIRDAVIGDLGPARAWIKRVIWTQAA